MEAYAAGQRTFGENKVQELADKHALLPKDIEWHLIGHLQTNKVKYVVPFVHLIHAVDSLKLLEEIDRQGAKNLRVVHVLLQAYIAEEETKFGLSFEEISELLHSDAYQQMQYVRVRGLMGMATNTDDKEQVKKEFSGLKQFFDKLNTTHPAFNENKMQILSMGMSGDYELAMEAGSTHIRVGSAIFGKR